MSEAILNLANRLREEGEKTGAFFRSLPPDAWGYQIYAEGARWTLLEILIHLIQSEVGVTRLIENILAGGPGVPEDFDLNRYNESKVDKIKTRSAEELLAEFSRSRARTVALVTSMNDEDMIKVGRHPFLGLAKVKDIVKLIYRHNQIHQRDIRRTVKEMSGR